MTPIVGAPGGSSPPPETPPRSRLCRALRTLAALAIAGAGITYLYVLQFLGAER